MIQITNQVFRNIVGAVSVAAALLLLSGCSGGGGESKPTGTVSGKVTAGSDAITEGSVQFYSAETGKGATAEIGQSGEFKFESPLEVGSYKVIVTPPPPPAPGPDTPEPKEYPNFPEKFRSEATTTLSADVKEGENPPMSFDLTK